MNLEFVKYIVNEPVFTGTYNNKSYKVLFVRSEVDYGWHFLDYLPDVTSQEAGTDQLDEFEQEDILEELSEVNWREIKDYAE